MSSTSKVIKTKLMCRYEEISSVILKRSKSICSSRNRSSIGNLEVIEEKVKKENRLSVDYSDARGKSRDEERKNDGKHLKPRYMR